MSCNLWKSVNFQAVPVSVKKACNTYLMLNVLCVLKKYFLSFAAISLYK